MSLLRPAFVAVPVFRHVPRPRQPDPRVPHGVTHPPGRERGRPRRRAHPRFRGPGHLVVILPRLSFLAERRGGVGPI